MSIKKRFKVIISDLDGTLLNNEHQISEYTKTIFQQLHEEKYLIIVATGRHHLDAMPLLKDLGCPFYLVTSNGARIHSPIKELIYSFDIKSDAIKSILDLVSGLLETDPSTSVQHRPRSRISRFGK